jgi:hypothetical protein
MPMVVMAMTTMALPVVVPIGRTPATDEYF